MQPQRTARVAVLAALVTVLAAPPAHADKWRVTSLSIKGTHVARYDDGDKTLDLDSTAFYKGQRLGKPFELRLSDRKPKVITAPASYVGGSEATYTTSGRAFKCDHFVAADATGIAAVLTVSPNGIRVQWSLAPMGYRCPQEANPVPPSFNPLPTGATVQKLSVKRFTGKSAVLPVNIRWSGAKDGWTQTITWKGKVNISRIKKKR